MLKHILKCLALMSFFGLIITQGSDSDCLKEQVGILDGDFYFFNSYNISASPRADDIANLLSLFKSRFRRVHFVTPLNFELVQVLTNGLKHYLKISNETLPIFLRIDHGVDVFNPEQYDIRIIDYEYRKIFNFLLQMESENPSLNFRIYLDSTLDNKAKMILIEGTLEHAPYTSIPIGLHEDCDQFLADVSATTILNKLAFLTCDISSQFSDNPVEEANVAIEMCEGYRKLVISFNSSAEVMCLSDHSPIQVVNGQEIGSAINFESFWCRIASKLKSNRTLSRFIMYRVFDIKESYSLNVGGLWHRKHGSACGKQAFIDITQEFQTKLMNTTQKEMLPFNFLAKNPRLFDGGFNFFYNFANTSIFNDETATDCLSLFFTRFNRAHIFSNIPSSSIKILRNAITQVNKNRKTNAQLFLSGPPGEITNNISQAIKLLTDAKKSTMELNSVSNGTVVGLYLNFMFTDYPRQLEVVNRVFGNKASSLIHIGHFLNCERYFVNQDAAQYLKRLDFITCNLEEGETLPPEEQADLYVSSCDKYRQDAQSLNLTSKILCSVEYASKGGVHNGRIGLSLDFYRFWHQLSNEVNVNNTHAPLIMRGTVDVQNFRHLPYPANTTGYYNTGWWRKTHVTSTEQGAFVEKIEEIPFGRMSGKCSKICQACNNDNDCCFGSCLPSTDVMISSVANIGTICKKQETICPSPEEEISINHESLTLNLQRVVNNTN